VNKLDRQARAQVLHLLCEGSSIRAVTRITGKSKMTVTKLAVDAGKAAAWYQGRVFQNLQCKRLQLNEVWGFVGAKAKNADQAKKFAREQGDAWLWVATCADTKLVPSWLVGGRDGDTAIIFTDELQSRLANRVQITSDGHKAYLDAAFGGDVDYAMLVKIYGPSSEHTVGRYSPAECIGARKERIEGNPDMKHVSTSYAERQNLTMRMQMRRFTRLTNAFSKKFENHMYMVALYTVWYNFVKQHKSLDGLSPAMAAGLSPTLWSVAELAEMVDATLPKGGPRGSYKKEISN
jgi:IS1 family transposase